MAENETPWSKDIPPEEEVKVRTRIVADGYKDRAERKRLIVEFLAEHDQTTNAAKAAGVAYHTYRKWREDDPEFDEECKVAFIRYRDRVMKTFQERIFDGWISKERVTTLRDGSEVREKEWKFAESSMNMEAKRVESGFKDRQEIAISGTGGGVIIVPPVFKTAEEWLLFVARAKEIIPVPPHD
jgi:hypothetical protein